MLGQYTLCINHYVYYQSLCLMCIPMCYFLMIIKTHITSAIVLLYYYIYLSYHYCTYIIHIVCTCQ